MISDFGGTGFPPLRTNGCTTSRLEPIESGWLQTQISANLRDSLTNRQGRFRAWNIDVRDGGLEVVGTRPRQNLLLYILEISQRSTFRPQTPKVVWRPLSSHPGVRFRRSSVDPKFRKCLSLPLESIPSACASIATSRYCSVATRIPCRASFRSDGASRHAQ